VATARDPLGLRRSVEAALGTAADELEAVAERSWLHEFFEPAPVEADRRRMRATIADLRRRLRTLGLQLVGDESRPPSSPGGRDVAAVVALRLLLGDSIVARGPNRLAAFPQKQGEQMAPAA